MYSVFVAVAVLGLTAAGGLHDAHAQQSQPVSVTAVGSVGDGGSKLLGGAFAVDVFTIGQGTYAAVASRSDGGLQIVNVTDPDRPTTAGNLGDDVSRLLDSTRGVDVFTIGQGTYAAVAAFNDKGLQIVNVTDPDRPTTAGNLGDDVSRLLGGAQGVDVFTIGQGTYAAVAAFNDKGLQIVNVTDPDSPTAAGNLGDNSTLKLDGAQGVDVFTIGQGTYAAVASGNDHGLQIVNVTDPDSPTAAGNLGDNSTLKLGGAQGVDVFTIGQGTYAAVASNGENGLQIVNVTDPDNLVAAGNVGDGGSRKLDGAAAVNVFTIGSSTYAAVASHDDHGLQIVNVTDPDSPTAAGNIGDEGSTRLRGSIGVEVFTIGSSTYAAVAAFFDNGLQIVRLDVETPNAPPVAPDETATTLEDTPVTITPAISDSDTSDTPVISVVDDPPNGNVTHDDITITYTPDSDYDGTDTFGYTVTDGTDTAQGTVTVTVTRDNNDPVLGTIGDQTATLDVQLTITPTVTDADPTDTHTYSISRGTLPAAAAFTPSDGSITWTPVQADAGQTHTVTITVNDGRGGTDSETFDIAVADAPNAPPVAPDETATTARGHARYHNSEYIGSRYIGHSCNIGSR